MAFPSRPARRAILAALVLAAAPAVAFANEKGEGESAPPIIKMQAMGLPVIVDKRLVNYVFVMVNLNLAPDVPLTIMDGKEPLLRDTLIRTAHRAPFVRPDTYDAIDEARFKTVVLRESAALVGPGKVIGVTLLKQTPKSRLGPPRPKAPPQTAAAPPNGDLDNP